jgi:CBS domain-containing protein
MTSVAQLLKARPANVWTIASKTSVFDALALMAKKDIGALPVVHEDKLVGMFSERDYARKVALQGRTSKTTTVSELMTSKVYYVRPDQTVEDCMALMTEKRIRHLPVLDGQKLVGIVTIGDLVKSIITAQEITIRSLQNYITGSYEA